MSVEFAEVVSVGFSTQPAGSGGDDGAEERAIKEGGAKARSGRFHSPPDFWLYDTYTYANVRDLTMRGDFINIIVSHLKPDSIVSFPTHFPNPSPRLSLSPPKEEEMSQGEPGLIGHHGS